MNAHEAVRKGADIFDGAEKKARTIKNQFRQLRKVFEAVRDEGYIGALECQAVASECDVLATEFEAKIWAMHRKLTVRAQELGIDLPQRDGGR